MARNYLRCPVEAQGMRRCPVEAQRVKGGTAARDFEEGGPGQKPPKDAALISQLLCGHLQRSLGNPVRLAAITILIS